MQSSSMNNRNPDEVDAFEIAGALWARVWVIVGVTVVAVLIGVLYAFMSERVYEARAYLVPPTQSDIADLNLGRTREFELAPYSIDDVYRVFIRCLQSETLRREFFVSEYLPKLGAQPTTQSQDSLYAEFSKKIQIAPLSADEMGRYSVVVQSNTAETAVDWVKSYVSRAEALATKQLMKNVSYEAKARSKNVDQEINTKRETGENARVDDITKLRAALSVAQAAGVQKPTVILGGVPAAMAGSGIDDQSFLKGVEALSAEIKNLESRSSNDAYIKELRDLQAKKTFYDKLAVTSREVGFYRYDGSVEPPDNPIKPKKSLVIMLALVLGLMLGVLSAFALYRFDEAKKSGNYAA